MLNYNNKLNTNNFLPPLPFLQLANFSVPQTPPPSHFFSILLSTTLPTSSKKHQVGRGEEIMGGGVKKQRLGGRGLRDSNWG